MPPPSLRRLGSVDDLLDPGRLESVLDAPGPVRVERLNTVGYSGSRFHRVSSEDEFIVKETVLSEDWFSNRTEDDVGREAAALLAPELDRIHEIFRLPYRAVAMEPGRVGLLMEDVSPWLLPDEREPLDPGQEELLLDTLARLHASFWEADELERLDWLQGSADFLHVMGPRGHGDEAGTRAGGGSARRVQDAIRSGWRTARDLLPDRLRRALWRPASEIATAWADLPVTLVHGDTKVANFAVLPAQRVCALDWAFVGRAPCTFEVGWYLAVNASRLVRSKEETLRRYRERLEERLGRRLEDDLWDRMEEAGLVCAGLMLLWSKAAGVEAGRDGAQSEWEWWESRLSAWAERAACV